jgi:nitroimidazol reductase NimA-like FMN-containing flavoprotein (pyridoxamine 5'-phosphate oxidase superfamily)
MSGFSKVKQKIARASMKSEREDNLNEGSPKKDNSGPDIPLDQRIRGLVTEQPVAVLCTQGEGQPYGSLVFFSSSNDLRFLVFATPRATRKYRLLTECDHVAIVLDSRIKLPEDMMKVEAVTVTGRAAEVEEGPEFGECADLLVGRHPYLKSFVAAPSSALFRVDVVRYIHVSRFQEVRQWTPPR